MAGESCGLYTQAHHLHPFLLCFYPCLCPDYIAGLRNFRICSKLTALMPWITIHRMAFPSALIVLVTVGIVLLVGCGGDATSTRPLPTPVPAATSTSIPSTMAATVPAATPTTPLATSALSTSQPAPSQTPTPELQPLTAETLDLLAAYVEENRELYKVPGTAVVVVQGGEVVFAQGFGVKEAGGDDPVTPDTVFSIGSLTKPMTSMMAATLVDEELMGWDTPVVEIMPQFQLSDAEAAGQITLRHLFSHTTGLPNIDLTLLFAGLPQEGLIEFFKGVPLKSQPGESRTYQNEAYAVGAYVAAMVFGGGYGDNLLETYIKLMKSRVFDPIGMSSATFSAEDAESSPDHATPHYSTINGTLAETGFDITPTHYWDIGAVAPAGSIGASAMDVGRFLMTMLAEGVAPPMERGLFQEKTLPRLGLNRLKPTFPIWLKSFLSNSSMVFQALSNYGPFLRVPSYNNSMICHFAVRCRRHHGGT